MTLKKRLFFERRSDVLYRYLNRLRLLRAIQQNDSQHQQQVAVRHAVRVADRKKIGCNHFARFCYTNLVFGLFNRKYKMKKMKPEYYSV